DRIDECGEHESAWSGSLLAGRAVAAAARWGGSVRPQRSRSGFEWLFKHLWLASNGLGRYHGSIQPQVPRFGGTIRSLESVTMLEALRSDEIVNKVGGRFKLCALIQRRMRELIIDGARPLVEREGRTDLELVIEEIMQDKIEPRWVDATDGGHKNGAGWPIEQA
ncbi:MAG: DNA-directed RNA polymerase subunit omega, partial [Phycisphaerales bacterium]|nr:DNA-directed RNA polymerase subunit omega [Phycisphaerales bacterium]